MKKWLWSWFPMLGPLVLVVWAVVAAVVLALD
jgi:hypothetical protein